MIDYIKVINYDLVVVYDHRQIILDTSFKKFINQKLKTQLVNLMTREKITKIKYKFKGKVPLVINKDLILICIKSYRNKAFYINYYSILDWDKDGQAVIVYFKNHYCMRLMSHRSFINQLNKVQVIINDHIL